MTGLLERLRRRKLVQWALAYAAGAWVLLQVLGLAADSYEWPRMVMRLSIGSVVVGFLATLVLAWYHGERGQQKVGGTELMLLALLFTLGGAGLWRIERHAGTPAVEATAVAAPAREGAKSIAVLPFENLSRDPDNAYFVDGIQDEILTRLAKVSALKVISRTSTQQYAARPGNLARIARELGVANVLEGSVQRVGGKLRVNVQLIAADTDAHLWAESYDRDTTDIFAVESEIAQAVADALQATLLPAESARIAAVPTTNARAYDRFLQAEYYARRLHDTVTDDPTATVHRATALYREAITADPGFALAHARLSFALGNAYWRAFDRDPASMVAAEAAARQALALQPDLPEAHLAMGYVHYWGQRDYAAALAEFERARASLPNDSDVIAAMAYIHRRQGRLELAVSELAAAAEFDPRDTTLPRDQADTLGYLRRYREAIAVADRSLVLAPDNSESFLVKVSALQMGGDLEGAARLLAAWPDAMDPEGSVTYVRHQFALARRQPAEALAALEHAHDWLLDGENNIRVPTAFLRGQALAAAGDAAGARTAYRDAKRLLEATPPTPGEEAATASTLAFVHAGLGEREDAIASAQRAIALMPTSRDGLDGPVYFARLPRIEAQVGLVDDALGHLAQALAVPAGYEVSPASLRTDPAWDPLRADPRFASLLTQASP
jgi:TolB-like protein/Flp pilus assembly protein TadD